MGQRRAVLGVLVGAVVMAGVALGAGSASAADGDSCTVLGTVGIARGSDCVDPGSSAVIGPLASVLDATAPGGSAASSPTGSAASSGADPSSSGEVGGAAAGVGGVTAPVVVPVPGAGSSTTGSSAGDPPAAVTPRGTGPHPRAVGSPAPAAPAALPAPAPLAAPAAALPRPAPGVVVPATLPAGLPAPALTGTAGLAGLAGSGSLAPALGGAVGYDPASLFAGAPATPLATLLAGNPALSATTASQVQAMALEGPNGTPGTPATLGVLAVAALAGLGVRYRVTSRLRGRERDTHPEPAESGTGG